MVITSTLTAVLLFHNGVAAAQAAGEAIGCRKTSSAPPAIWRPPPTAAHGVQEFTQSALIEVPVGISTMTVELWGAGGGGGGGSPETYSEGGAGGGGGASGDYVRGTIAVRPGVIYAVIVGKEGRGGAMAMPGQQGEDSVICTGDVPLLVALGGSGGQGAMNNSHGGQGGHARIADLTDTNTSGVLRRVGNDGAPGTLPLFEYRGWGGRGGSPVFGSVQPKGAFGGTGGAGEMRPDHAASGESGGAGSVILGW
jgi:hypothetical protein